MDILGGQSETQHQPQNVEKNLLVENFDMMGGDMNFTNQLNQIPTNQGNNMDLLGGGPVDMDMVVMNNNQPNLQTNDLVTPKKENKNTNAVPDPQGELMEDQWARSFKVFYRNDLNRI